MNKRILGVDLEVSALGFGCMGLSHAYGPACEKEEAVRLIRSAAEIGYTFFDTAECYLGTYADGREANNEEVVGEALHPIRNEVVIASKFGVRHEGRQLIVDSRPETIRKSVEGSLRRLDTETIDLYYQHRIDPQVEPEAVAETMAQLIREGKIRYWGISEATEEYLRRANAVCRVTAVQNRYSMMARWHEDLFPVLEELQVGFVAFSPLANGILSNAYSKDSAFEKGDFRSDMPQYRADAYEKNKGLFDLLQSMADSKAAAPAQISLAWMLEKKPYIVPIPGSRKYVRIKENAVSTDVILTVEDVEKIDAALADIPMSEVFGGHSVSA
ncbi:MAG: aldo/keto reductase [Lachnospiraceae bacterium]|nr:aldo/keto reductase [Lachnospiraceae bacterium]